MYPFFQTIRFKAIVEIIPRHVTRNKYLELAWDHTLSSKREHHTGDKTTFYVFVVNTGWSCNKHAITADAYPVRRPCVGLRFQPFSKSIVGEESHKIALLAVPERGPGYCVSVECWVLLLCLLAFSSYDTLLRVVSTSPCCRYVLWAGGSRTFFCSCFLFFSLSDFCACSLCEVTHRRDPKAKSIVRSPIQQ